MIIELYEEAILEDGTIAPGRLVGEVRCKGDGTEGTITFFDTCNEIWDVRDKNSRFYGTKDIILNEREKKRFRQIFRESVDISRGGRDGEDGSIRYSTSRTVSAWHREGIANIIKYTIPNALCGNIMTKIIEED
ncbi:MAG: hypothetical protein ABRQ39_29290 [Candidatus Eremiobacterota bacterium]